MKRMSVLAPMIVLMTLGSGDLWFVIASGGENQVLFRLSDQKAITLQEAVPDLASVKVILVGELHNVKKHHDIQLEVIRALHGTGLRLAVGMEMFRRESQEILDQWVGGSLSEARFIRAYSDNWNAPWALYADILRFAREKKIPLVGLNVSREITRQVVRGGFASLSDNQRKELPPVRCAVDENYRKFIQRALDLHGHPTMDFNNFCEAQLLWDTAMAWHAIQYLKSHPDRTVVVLAGNGHAWKPGIPRHLESLFDYTYRVILPEISGRSERNSTTVSDSDYLWLD